jgi:hypothetical protein
LGGKLVREVAGWCRGHRELVFAAGGRQRECPLDDQAPAGFGSEDLFGFAMSPYLGFSYRDHETCGLTRRLTAVADGPGGRVDQAKAA